MGCGSCGKNNGSHSPGCGNNGNCGTGGCNKLNVYNWLSDVILPEDYTPFDVVEVRFKGSKKLFVRNVDGIELFTGDRIIVSSDIGYDLGEVSLAGELVKLHLKKYGVEADNPEMRTILRKASEPEIERYQQWKDAEPKMLERARTIAIEMKLQMKISDIELQADGKKVTFYYTSEGRVDFRELIKRYATEFKSRIEMRQVSYREEASRLGGIGSCGRELCCSTWLTEYKVVSMGAAKKQNLSINMLKLSGQCGRLKCCLNYELELYSELVAQFPKEDQKLRTTIGMASLKKIDILKKTGWYCYDNSKDWIALDLDRINEILAENRAGKFPETLALTAQGSEITNKTPEYLDDLLKDNDIKRMDNKPRPKNARGSKPRNNNSNPRNNQNRKTTAPSTDNKRPATQMAENTKPAQSKNSRNKKRNNRRPNTDNTKPNTNDSQK